MVSRVERSVFGKVVYKKPAAEPPRYLRSHGAIMKSTFAVVLGGRPFCVPFFVLRWLRYRTCVDEPEETFDGFGERTAFCKSARAFGSSTDPWWCTCLHRPSTRRNNRLVRILIARSSS